MKYFVILGDGMADEPLEVLDNKTPLEVANTPQMDQLAPLSEIGLSANIPEGMKPGSDTANLAVLGYNPRQFYSGRSPLEALSIGVSMKDSDIAVRCNIVTLSDDALPYERKIMIDHSSSEISTEDAAILLEAVRKEFENETYQFYTGTSYRHCLIINKGEVMELSQPHDILERVIGPYLPSDSALYDMMKQSYDILNNHPLNVERAKKGLHKANSLWFWGAGTKPLLTSFEDRTGKKGAMISAVDLLKGIAVGAKMKVIKVEGADGTLHTNYRGKANAAIEAVLKDGMDFVYVHVEAPDEMGHQGSIERKILAIEKLDSEVIRPIKEAMDASGEPYRMLILPDHPTPIACRTHTSDPVPYLLYDSELAFDPKAFSKALGKNSIERMKKSIDGKGEIAVKSVRFYNEKEAARTGIFVEKGYRLIEKLMQFDAEPICGA